MLWAILKVLIAGALISFSSWLANKKPILAGFIIALPLTTILALSLNYIEFQNVEKSVKFAKSVFLAVPLSLTFFIPFLFAEKMKFSFWQLMGTGFVLLTASFLVHQYIFKGNLY